MSSKTTGTWITRSLGSVSRPLGFGLPRPIVWMVTRCLGERVCSNTSADFPFGFPLPPDFVRLQRSAIGRGFYSRLRIQ